MKQTSFATVLLIALLLYPTLAKAGETIVFPGDPLTGNDLMPSPISPSGNTVSVSSGTITGAVFGSNILAGTTQGNTVYFSGGTIGQSLYGANVTNGDAIGNTITMSAGTVNHQIYGSYIAANGNAINNTLWLTGGQVLEHVYGATSTGAGKMAQGNAVYVAAGFIGNQIYGASSGGDSIGNSVFFDGATTITNGVANGNLVGGVAGTGVAQDNSVVVQGNASVDGRIYGGYALNGISRGNTATVLSGSIADSLHGGYSLTGTATANTLQLYGGTYGNNAYGGVAAGASGDATANTLLFAGGQLVGNAYGGSTAAAGGSASGNSVTVQGGTLGSVYGGFVDNTGGTASNNSVALYGGQINGNIYGGSLNGAGSATGNTVSLYAGNLNITGSTLYGGYSTGTGNVFSGNTLQVNGFRGRLAGIKNFEFYQFVLPAGLQSGETLLSVATPVDTANTTVEITSFQEVQHIIAPGTRFVLIDNTINTPAKAGSYSVEQGAFVTYTLEVATESNQLIAHVKKLEANQSAPSLSTGVESAVLMTNRGGNLLVTQGMQAAQNSGKKMAVCTKPQKNTTRSTNATAKDFTTNTTEAADTSPIKEDENKATVFAVATGGYLTHNRGGWATADVTGFSLLAGVSRNIALPVGCVTLGAFTEAGNGDYTSTVQRNAAPAISASGNVQYMGGGLLARFALQNGLYTEGSVRAGQTTTDYESKSITFNEQTASYDISSLYLGAHTGAGYRHTLGENLTLDTYGKYLWLRHGSANAMVLGQKADFDAVNSHRLRGGSRLEYATPHITPYFGVAYEYEMGGDSKSRVQGLPVRTVSMEGGSALLEFGVRVNSASNNAFSVVLGGEGSLGMQEGAGGNLQLQYAF